MASPREECVEKVRADTPGPLETMLTSKSTFQVPLDPQEGQHQRKAGDSWGPAKSGGAVAIPTPLKAQDRHDMVRKKDRTRTYTWANGFHCGENHSFMKLRCMADLSAFYTPRLQTQLLVPLITEDKRTKSILSLNALQYFMATQSHQYSIGYWWTPLPATLYDGTVVEREPRYIDVAAIYHRCMQTLTRNNMSTVRRGERVSFGPRDAPHTSTEGQLNGIRIAWSNGFITYYMANLEALNAIKQGRTDVVLPVGRRVHLMEPEEFDMSSPENWKQYMRVEEEVPDDVAEVEDVSMSDGSFIF